MAFLLRRVLFYVVAAWVAVTANFFIPRAMPGNAIQGIMAKFPGTLQPSRVQGAAGDARGRAIPARSGIST